jgi:uncharacterized membrane protein
MKLTINILLAMIILLMPIDCIAASFNLEINLPDTYKKVNPGTEVWFTIRPINLANTNRIDVTIKYDLVDEDNTILATNSKTVAIETQASFVASLRIPDNVKAGNYFVVVTLNSPLGESTARTSLKVVPKDTSLQLYYIAAAIILLGILILAIVKSKPIIEKIKLKMEIYRIVRKKLKK